MSKNRNGAAAAPAGQPGEGVAVELITSVGRLHEVVALFGASLPAVLRVTNNSPSALVLSPIDAHVQAREFVDYEFRDADQLQNLVTEAEAFGEINGWVDTLIISNGPLPVPEPAAAVEEAPAADDASAAA